MVEPRLDGAGLLLSEHPAGYLARALARLAGALLSDPIALTPAVGWLQQS